MKSTYLVSLLSPRLPEGNGRLLPCCCLQYVKDRFFMRTRKTPFRSPAPGFFPKASAKVRQFRELTKFFRGFFHEKRNFFFAPPTEVPARQVAESTKTAELCKREQKNNVTPVFSQTEGNAGNHGKLKPLNYRGTSVWRKGKSLMQKPYEMP